MYRIKALGDESSESVDVAAEEEISTVEVELENQYYQALQYIKDNNDQMAIETFKMLLENETVMAITNEVKAHRLHSLKYACWKNLAELHAKKKDDQNAALEFFLKAREVDSGDIRFMHRFGRLAVQMKQYLMAFDVFDESFRRNPNNFASMDGMLELLCAQENYFEAFGWALHCLDIHGNKYQKAIDVICDVRRILSGSPLLENAWSVKFNNISKRSEKASLFPLPIESSIDCGEPLAKFDEFKMERVSWRSVGQMILLLYENCEQVDSSNLDSLVAHITTKLTFGNICANSDIDDDDGTLTNTVHHNEDHEYMYKRNMKNFLDDFSKPIYDIFKKVVPTYFSYEESFEGAQSSQHERSHTENSVDHNEKYRPYLRQFIQDLQSQPFTFLDLVFTWLKYMSNLWDSKQSSEDVQLYIRVHENHQMHIDLNSWDQFPLTVHKDLLRMGIFYIELKVSSKKCSLVVEKGDIEQILFDNSTTALLIHLVSTCEMGSFSKEPEILLRLQLLHYQYALQINDLELASTLLERMQNIFNNSSDAPTTIFLPNRILFHKIDDEMIKQQQIVVNLHPKVTDIKANFENGQFLAVISDLKHFQHHAFETSQLTAMKQAEMLLECLWSVGNSIDCFLLAEDALYNSVSVWIWRESNGQPVSQNLHDHIDFVLSYLAELLRLNRRLVDHLKERKLRLLQSVARVFDIQYTYRKSDFKLNDLMVLVECLLHTDLKPEVGLSNPPSMTSNHTLCTLLLEITDLLMDNALNENCGGIFFAALSATVSLNPEMMRSKLEAVKSVTHVLYGYPKHLEQHLNCGCQHKKISWVHAPIMFELFENHLSLSNTEWEALLIGIYESIPADINEMLNRAVTTVEELVNGAFIVTPTRSQTKLLPTALKNLCYCLAKAKLAHSIGSDSEEIKRYIFTDLSQNPKRFDSWLMLTQIKIRQLDQVFSFTLKQTPNQLNALIASIDYCFERFNCPDELCESKCALERVVYRYKLYKNLREGQSRNFFHSTNILSSAEMLSELKHAMQKFNDLKYNKQMLEPNQQWIYSYLCASITENRGSFDDLQKVVQMYLSVENKLMELNDVNCSNMLCTVKFRVAATVYKYISFPNITIDDKTAEFLIDKLNRFQTKDFINLDSNANEIPRDTLTTIINLCIKNFESCLSERPNFYKAKYYLAKIYLRSPSPIGSMPMCHSFLLRKSNIAGNQFGLFCIHRKRQIFYAIDPLLPLDQFSAKASVYKYMEKSICILVDYLILKSDHYLLIVLVHQWIDLLNDRSEKYLQKCQKEELFVRILNGFHDVIEHFLKNVKHDATKSKRFVKLFSDVFDAYTKLVARKIENKNCSVFEKLLQMFYTHYNKGPAAGDTDHERLNHILEFCKSEFTEKTAESEEPSQTEDSSKRTGIQTKFSFAKPSEKKLGISEKSKKIKRNKKSRLRNCDLDESLVTVQK